jgi:hypothetical protein
MQARQRAIAVQDMFSFRRRFIGLRNKKSKPKSS